MLFFLPACTSSATEPPAEPGLPSPPGYDQLRSDIEAERVRLAGGEARSSAGSPPPKASRAAARAVLRTHVVERFVPAWLGTGWDFYGTASRPGEGDIACGHWVGTLLRDAGFRVDRLAVGRLPSESIIGLFATPEERWRFRDQTPGEIADALRATIPDGLYGVGLDFHAGLLIKDGPSLAFCHASYVADAVVCEDPVQSPAFPSRYTVVGPLLTDRAIDAWLAGAVIATP